MNVPLRTNVRRFAYLPLHQIQKRVKRKGSPSDVHVGDFDDLLEEHSKGESEVLVHAGLRDIRAAFDTDPYVLLRNKLDEHFESTLIPGFTDYFKTSGVYHVEYSKPKHGTFGELFLEDADYRTRDAIKSFLVRGPYRFDGCEHHHSYHPDGCFAKLVEDDVLVMNIGVPWITCSHLHYLEHVHDVDYLTEATYEGVMYTNETEHSSISQTCSVYRSKFFSWNKPKIQRKLVQEGVAHTYDLGGLWVSFFSLRDTMDVIGAELERNQYYLVTL